jgi:hypothetical protein
MNAIHGQGKAAFKGGEQASLKAAAAAGGGDRGKRLDNDNFQVFFSSESS